MASRLGLSFVGSRLDALAARSCAMDSRVGREVSSVGFWGGGRETMVERLAGDFVYHGGIWGRTCWFFGEEITGVVVVYCPYC